MSGRRFVPHALLIPHVRSERQASCIPTAVCLCFFYFKHVRYQEQPCSTAIHLMLSEPSVIQVSRYRLSARLQHFKAG